MQNFYEKLGQKFQYFPSFKRNAFEFPRNICKLQLSPFVGTPSFFVRLTFGKIKIEQLNSSTIYYEIVNSKYKAFFSLFFFFIYMQKNHESSFVNSQSYNER